METLLQDIVTTLRGLRRAPAFTFIAVLTLALGIGADTALFSVVNGVLLAPLPYAHPDQLMSVYSNNRLNGPTGTSYPNFLDWQRMNHSFSALAAVRFEDYDLSGAGEPERLQGMMVSASFLDTLAVHPVLGRAFTADDDQPSAGHVALLGTGFWKRKFGADRTVAGRVLTLNGVNYTVVGVVPDAVPSNGPHPDVFVPLGQWNDPTFRSRNVSMGMNVIGRLRPGVSQTQAAADLDVVGHALAATYPASNKDTTVALRPLRERLVGNVRPFLLILLAAVGFVLLIACANVANLLLVRTTLRAREFAVRAAMGARRVRIARQLLTECLLLSLAGAGLGWLFAAWGTRAALRALPAALPRMENVALDGTVLGFTVLIAVGTALLFGLAPAWRAAAPNLVSQLSEGGRGGIAGRQRLQLAMVALQVALAFVLLIGAGLMIRSLSRLWRVNPGLNPDRVLTFSLTMPPGLEAKPDVLRTDLDQMAQRLDAIPGVTGTSLDDGSMPLSGSESDIPFWPAGQAPPASQNDMDDALFYLVQPDYLHVMQTPLLRGRFLTAADTHGAPEVVVVDDLFAAKFFPHADVMGQRIHLAVLDSEPVVVGVVAHVKHFGLDETPKDAMGEMYIPVAQTPDKLMPLLDRGGEAVLRTQGAPEMVLPVIRRALQTIDATEVVYDAKPMNALLTSSLANRRFTLILLGVFAGLAFLLAGIGIYGVLAYITAQRTREIGVRMALGAKPGEILGLVVRQAGRMAGIGIAVGVVAALALTRLMTSLLYGIPARDPVTFLAVALLLALAALVACVAPALRALRVDPTVALRCE